MLEQVAEDPSLRSKLKEPEQLSPPLLQLIDVPFKYKRRSDKELDAAETQGNNDTTSDNNTLANKLVESENNNAQTKTQKANDTGAGDLLIVQDCNLNIDMESRIAVKTPQDNTKQIITQISKRKTALKETQRNSTTQEQKHEQTPIQHANHSAV